MTRFFITGCASGIGKRLTERLLSQGNTVYATDLDLDTLNAAAKDGGWPDDRVHTAHLDVRDAEQWETVFAQAADTLGGIDVTVNNAGVMHIYWAHETPVELTDLMFDVNTKGVIFGTQTAARHMMKNGGGHIINIASLAGVTTIKGFSVYCASKFAVRAYSLTAAEEFAPHNIAVTTVCPDAVDTPLIECENKDKEEAAMFWHAPSLLKVDDVVDVITGRVLAKRPRIVYIPPVQGFLSRLSMAFPNLLGPVLKLVERMSRKNQEKFLARK